MKVVIIAGGKGTRIASVNSEIPKAMIPVCGKPVLEHQVVMARRYGFTEFIFLIGHLGDNIKQYFGRGEKWGVSIEYYHERQPLGTAGALAEIQHLLSDDFFVFYGDTVMDIHMNRMLDFHREKQACATLFVHPNDHPFDSDIVLMDSAHRVTGIEAKPHATDFESHNMVNAALFILSKEVVKRIPKGQKSHIEKNILPVCLQDGLPIYGYVSTEYVKDMGTPERYEHVCNDWKSGRVASMNLEKKQKAVFLDRDGVLNVDSGQIYRCDQVELIGGVGEALRYIHDKGYLAIVVTNQSVIARNLCSFEELDAINQRMETLLGKERAYIDGIYICPHHPDGGYPEERKEYKVKCQCRKPAPGLLLQASQEWNINLEDSFMIGDRQSDVLAGENAGVKQSVLIPTNQSGALLSAVEMLLK